LRSACSMSGNELVCMGSKVTRTFRKQSFASRHLVSKRGQDGPSGWPGAATSSRKCRAGRAASSTTARPAHDPHDRQRRGNLRNHPRSGRMRSIRLAGGRSSRREVTRIIGFPDQLSTCFLRFPPNFSTEPCDGMSPQGLPWPVKSERFSQFEAGPRRAASSRSLIAAAGIFAAPHRFPGSCVDLWTTSVIAGFPLKREAFWAKYVPRAQ
jgi:hypothetical protein